MQDESVEVEQVVENEVELRQFGEDVAKATATFERLGKPDLEDEQRQRALALGISDDGIAARWERAKTNWRKASQTWHNGRRLPKLLEPPRPKPIAEKIVINEGLPTTEAAPSVLEKPQPQAKAVSPEVKQRAMVRFNPAKNPFNQNGFENARIALGLMEFDCALDLFHHKPVIRGKHAWLGGDGFEDLDNVVMKLREMMLDEFGFDPKGPGAFDALRARCLNNSFNPLLDYLDSVQWDGVPRLDRWLSIYACADDTALNRAFGRKTLVAAVRRPSVPALSLTT